MGFNFDQLAAALAQGAGATSGAASAAVDAGSAGDCEEGQGYGPVRGGDDDDSVAPATAARTEWAPRQRSWPAQPPRLLDPGRATPVCGAGTDGAADALPPAAFVASFFFTAVADSEVHPQVPKRRQPRRACIASHETDAVTSEPHGLAPEAEPGLMHPRSHVAARAPGDTAAGQTHGGARLPTVLRSPSPSPVSSPSMTPTSTPPDLQGTATTPVPRTSADFDGPNAEPETAAPAWLVCAAAELAARQQVQRALQPRSAASALGPSPTPAAVSAVPPTPPDSSGDSRSSSPSHSPATSWSSQPPGTLTQARRISEEVLNTTPRLGPGAML